MKSPEIKDYSGSFSVKDATLGQVEAVVSCYGNVDSDGDVMVRGAFARDIADGKQKGKLPPGVMAHDWAQPVAKTLDAWEGDDGLHVIAQFNLETQRGRESFSDIKAGIITEYSFGFRTRDSEQKDGNRHITDAAWYEWSPVLVGSNRATYTAGVKEAKADDEPSTEAEESGLETDGTQADEPEESEKVRSALADYKAGLMKAYGLDRGLSLEAHSAGVVAVLTDYRTRLADLKQLKAGRVFSAANRDRLASHASTLRDTAADMEAMMLEEQRPPDETEPATSPTHADPGQANAAYARFQASRMAMHGYNQGF